uniref:Zinc finger MYM-type protein 4-like n=1 Tax=Seriola lalandi dorsalis TaxID=1841481 RepID=A0A3B4YN85_SERLL
MDEGVGESSFPRISSPSSDRPSSFNMRTNEGGGGGSGGAAFDDALDGLPMYGPEEEDEDWHFALPMGTLEDVDVSKANRKRSQPEEGNNAGRADRFAHEPRGVEEEREREDSVGSRSEAAPVEDRNPPMSPTINIKDEPIDEGYDAALLPQSSIRQIKEELDQSAAGTSAVSCSKPQIFYACFLLLNVIRITQNDFSSLPTFLLLSTQVPAAIPAPPPAAIFIPGRGTVLQAMGPVPVRPPAPIPSSLPALAPVPPRPPQPPVPGSVRCSGCSKVLLKGQTAFQRKGSTQLFCSTVCLTGHLCLTFFLFATLLAPDHCIHSLCLLLCREIVQPRDMITIPADDSTYMHFCGQFCLSVFRHKKKHSDKIPDKWADKRIEHEVTHQGRLHRLCSDACFVTWRKMRQLAMNCCEGCGLYCNSNSGSCQTLTIERSQLNFCGPTCIGTYKQTCRKMAECPYCHKMAVVSSTIMERDQRGKIQLYCSPACVELSRPPRHVLTGTAFPCCLCKVSAVPQYHLAMVDGTIRNFCSYDCVSIYRKSGHPPQPDLTNGTFSLRDPSIRDAPKPGPSVSASSVPPIPQDYPSSVPYQGHHPSHTSVPPLVPPYPAMSSPSVPGQAQARAPPGQPQKPTEGGHSDISKLTCHQCSKQFNTKPLLFSHQGRISMFCSKTCCEQYKTQKNILALCECCKQEKVHFDTISYNQQDLVFCSESCKLLFKHDLTSRNKDHPWRPCTYCSGIGQKMLHSHYGGRMEEFCRPHCMSQYTVLYYGMGRCDSCRKQGYMTEKLQCLGSVRNFCNLPCLLQYCYLHFETSQHASSNGTGTAPQTPYGKLCHISDMHADLLYLSSSFAGALPTSNVDGKNLDHASTQTDAMRVPVSRRRQMKNKSVLCRPFTMDQEIMCQLPTPSTASAEENVKVVMVPVPVPVFIPVPMNMYSQHTPVPMAMPMPVRPITFSFCKSLMIKRLRIKSLHAIGTSALGYLLSQRTTLSYYVMTDLNSTCIYGTRKTLQVHQLLPRKCNFLLSQLSIRHPVVIASLFIQGRRRTVSSERTAVVTPAASKLNHLYGVKAWKSWVQQRNKQPQELDIKEDILQCDSAELSFALSRFVREVRRPNGETYSPDSIFYLCLGIQQYLFMQGRIQNIFTDELYSQFATEITGMLQLWRPKLLPIGVVSSRVEESYLWECKQLGAYSPIVLLNTLLFFCTKTFHFTTLAQHQSLSFINFTRRSKACNRTGKVHYLQHQRSSSATPSREDTESRAENEGDMEMLENVTNPLHCPVRLYEFYLSRCPESVKKRTDVFYLQPEQNVHTHSSHWYTAQPLEGTTLQSMLTRILAVREVHQEQDAAQRQSSASTNNNSLQ